jgi:uncharacterized OsmC-like protein
MGEPIGPVQVTLRREGDDVQHFDLGAKSLPEIVIDWSALSKAEQDVEHFGARFLCVAALACFGNTFYNALRREGATVKSFDARASIKKEKDAIFRTRYTKILLEVNVKTDDEDAFSSVCEELELGSLVTYSLPEGIEVEHDIQRF